MSVHISDSAIYRNSWATAELRALFVDDAALTAGSIEVMVVLAEGAQPSPCLAGRKREEGDAREDETERRIGLHRRKDGEHRLEGTDLEGPSEEDQEPEHRQ